MKATFLIPLTFAALVLFAACSDTEEQVDSSLGPTAAATPTVTPLGSGPSATSSAPTTAPIAGGLAPDGCTQAERSYADPAGRFAVCYSEGMEVVITQNGPSSNGSVTVRYPLTDANGVSITIGWEETPAYTPCVESLDVIKNQRIEKIVVDGVSVDACVQDHFDPANTGLYLRTTMDFAIPRKGGEPVLVLAGYSGESLTRSGLPAKVVVDRVLSSISVG